MTTLHEAARMALTDEQMHALLGAAGPDLMTLAQEWADNKIHVYAFVNRAERIVADRIRAALAASEAQSNAWREAVDAELVSLHMVASDDPRESVRRLIDWHCAIQIDPSVSSAAQELIERGRREAASEAQAEPVAWRLDWAPQHSLGAPRFFGADDEARMRNHTAFAAEPKPVAVPLYTHPAAPQQPAPVWDGLTLGEVKARLAALNADELRGLCVSLMIQRRIDEKYAQPAPADPLMSREELIAAAESIGMRFPPLELPEQPAPAERGEQTAPTKAERVHALVNGGPFPGMSEAFDAHMGVGCWVDLAYRQDAATWAAAWKAALASAPRVPQGWKIKRDGTTGGIVVVTPSGDGCVVYEAETEPRTIPASVLHELAAAMLAAAPQPEAGA